MLEVEMLKAQLERVTKERNEFSWRITQLEMALGPFALLADECLEQKGPAWCKHWEALPVHMLFREQGIYTMPKLENCLKAKAMAEGGEEWNWKSE